MPHDDEDLMAKYRRQQRRTMIVVFGSLILIVGLVIGFALVINANKPEPQGAVAVTYESYQTAWESAMAKAGVEATFPVDPVNLADVQATGMQDFSATFTAEEITALLVMYPFEYDSKEGTVALQDSDVSFPAPGRGGFTGRLAAQGSRYKVQAEAPVALEGGKIAVSSEGSVLKVEGFGVGGDKRDQALAFVEDYLNALLAAAPRLTITSAEIVEGGVQVDGTCPVSLEHPAPIATE